MPMIVPRSQKAAACQIRPRFAKSFQITLCVDSVPDSHLSPRLQSKMETSAEVFALHRTVLRLSAITRRSQIAMLHTPQARMLVS